MHVAHGFSEWYLLAFMKFVCFPIYCIVEGQPCLSTIEMYGQIKISYFLSNMFDQSI